MKTEFKLIFEGKPDLEEDKFRLSLPKDFELVKKDDGFYIGIQSSSINEHQCQYLVDRELDRHFFLTSVRIKAEMVKKTLKSSISIKYRIHGSLPKNIGPQKWNYKLPIQLRLWSLALDSSEIQIKLILLYQIIELAFPDGNFRKYTDTTKAPHPLTECKFIRHLVAHSGDVKSSQLKSYSKYIGLPEVMLDVTDSHYLKIIASKVPLMEAEAKKVIEGAFQQGGFP